MYPREPVVPAPSVFPQRESEFPDEPRYRAGEVERQDIPGAEPETRLARVWRGRVVRVDHVLLDAVDEHQGLLFFTGVKGVPQAPAIEELHPHIGGEVQAWVSLEQSPAADKAGIRGIAHHQLPVRSPTATRSGQPVQAVDRPAAGRMRRQRSRLAAGLEAPRRTIVRYGAAHRLLLRYALQPLHGRLQRLGLSTVAGVTEERAVLRAPRTLTSAMITNANEEAVRARRRLVDTADAGREVALLSRGALRGAGCALLGLRCHVVLQYWATIRLTSE